MVLDRLAWYNDRFAKLTLQASDLMQQLFKEISKSPDHFKDCTKEGNVISFFLAGQKFIIKPSVTPDSIEKHRGTISFYYPDPISDDDKLIEAEELAFQFDNVGNLFKDSTFHVSGVIYFLKEHLPGVWMAANLKVWL